MSGVASARARTVPPTPDRRAGRSRPVGARPGATVRLGGAERGGPDEERRLLERLRSGDEAAFVALLEQHGPSLRRLARTYASESVADDVVQETWIAVLRGLDGYQGRASLRTWMVRILINVARGRAERDGRQVPFSTFAAPTGPEPSVDPDRFLPTDGAWAGHWISYPRRWDEQPEERYLSSEGVSVALAAIDALPMAQQEVVSLRDVEGWSSDEVCETLGITQANQRVLLHRGRSRVRAALERAIVRHVRTDGVLP